MKFASMQSHEKYPSWPVTQPSIESEGGEPIASPKFQPQLGTVTERNNSPISDKKNSEEYKRNASDPGFKKTYPFSNFMRRPKVSDSKESKLKSEDIKKETAEKIDDFFNSEPGYPKPQMDQDGNRIGDEKYSIPSPPERENQGPDSKTLSEKIASIVGPHHEVGGYMKDVGANVGSKRRSERRLSPQRSLQDVKQNEKFVKNSANFPKSASVEDSPEPGKGQVLVDTGTDPLPSSSESNKLPSQHSDSHLFKMPRETTRLSEKVTHYKPYIVKQMVCYNTGTQTEFSQQEKEGSDVHISPKIRDPKDNHYTEHSVNPRHSSSGSERDYSHSDHVRRASYRGSDVRRSASRSDRYSGSEFSQHGKEKRGSFGDNEEMAPMLRKLTHEYYGGRLNGSVSDKRLSSGSSQESSLRSPGSDYPVPFSQYGGMKEAESYNSVVIHPDGSSLPFGRDYAESRLSTSEARHDIGMDNERTNISSEPRSAFKPGRHSLDPSVFSPKYPLISTGSKSLHDSRYSSEANLQSPSHYGHRDHTRSMMSLSGKHSKSSSVSDEANFISSKQSFDSSSPSHPQSSSDTRSSASTHYSSDSSPYAGQTQGQSQFRSRRESNDSVFTDSPSASRTHSATSDTLSPLPKRPTDLNVPQGRIMGRSSSMKKAYGIYDEVERSFSASSIHRRQESDMTSNSSHSSLGGATHLRSHSHSEYIQMDQHRKMPTENQHLGLIREDSSELRWEEAVRKSRNGRKTSNSSSDHESNYANVDIRKQASFDTAKLEGYQHIDVYNRSRMESKSGLKRTSSEQIRPMKERIRDLNKENTIDSVSTMTDKSSVHSPAGSRLDLRPSPSLHSDVGRRSSSGSDQTIQGTVVQSQVDSKVQSSSPNSDSQRGESQPFSENFSKTSNSENQNSNLKKVQRNAVQEYVDRITQKKMSDSGEEENSAAKDVPLIVDVEKSRDGSKLTPTESFRQKYGHRAERAESLRRTRSVNSRDGSEYMEMKRPDKPHPQTEWSRIRSQTGGSRPHSIGSDSSLVDPYAVTPLSPMKDFLVENHQRSQSDSTNTGTQLGSDRSQLSAPTEDDGSSNLSQSSLVYQNVGYRRPPPVPPPESEEAPPALPPRNYRNYHNIPPDPSRYPRHNSEHARQEETGMDSGRSKGRWEASTSSTPDNYAEQLRRQARRLSEQQNMPPPMSYISSKVKINYSQSYKRLPMEPLEATPPGVNSGSVSPHSPGSTNQMHSNASSPNHISPLNIDTQDTRPPPTSPRSSWRQAATLPSPDPPPPPTPQKDDVIKMTGEDLPPPPPELVSNEEKEQEKYAEDSYAGYRSRTSRQPGVYKRSASSGDALKLLHENNNYKQQGEIPKPPRKRLQPQVWKSEQDVTTPELQPEEKPEVVPSFTATESSPVQLPPRSVTRPLGHSHSANYLFAPKPYNSPESSPHVVRNVPTNQAEGRPSVPEPSESKANDSEERPSVRERINQLNNKPVQSPSDRGLKQSFNVGNLKRTFEDPSKSPLFNTPENPSSRRSYEPPPPRETKFSSSYSESRLVRTPKDNVPVPDVASKSPELARSFADRRDFAHPGPLSPRRTSYPVESRRLPPEPSPVVDSPISERLGHGADKLLEYTEPPPIDRSAKSGYPGAVYRRDSFQNRRPSREQNISSSDINNRTIQHETEVKSHSPHFSRRFDEPQSSSSLHSKSMSSANSESGSSAISSDHVQNEAKDTSKSDSILSSSDVSSLNSTISATPSESPAAIPLHNRQPSAEELEADAKVQEFADQFKDEDPKLSTVLKHDSVNRMQYIDGLFTVDVEITPRRSPKSSPKSSSVSHNSSLLENGDVKTPTKEKDQPEKGENEKSETSPLPNSYWVSPSKALIEMDIRKSEDMGKEITQHIGDPDTLIKTKEELVSSIEKKLDKLKEEKEELIIEIEENEKIGKQVSMAVEQKCRSQHEKDKFKTYITDLEKIVLLLLKLSGLLARAENAYQSLPENCDARQKKIANDKRERLQQQYEEAINLKTDIDKRSKQVMSFLRECFLDSEMEDYNYYIKMKKKLTIEKQELEDKLTLGEEQITALKRSIPGKY
ncbi:hypothetical protein FSP39_001040 [Pinctada imbricata]|uniref:ASD2 domain-containing protein n=1 Tax=Pinctada imbricata TaxID=66713 RepID=A0AA88YC28_PINIB|nr:hypothetical protein FSP39_001040 [Pinctada imbricata]